jgi:hypothetical protein
MADNGLGVSIPTGLGYSPANLDLASQLAEIERRRQVEQGLLYGSMLLGPTQFTPGGAGVSGVAIRHTPGELLARAATGALASKGLSDLAQEQQGIGASQAAKVSSAMQDLGAATQPMGGTPSTITEQPGPPSPGDTTHFPGEPSVTEQIGSAPQMDPQAFYRAYARAQFAGADPSMMKLASDQFLLNQLRAQRGMPVGAPSSAAPTMTTDPTTGARTWSQPTSALLASGASLNGPAPSVEPPPETILGGTGEYAKAYATYNQPRDVKPGSTEFRNGQPFMTAPDANGRYTDWSSGSPVLKVVPGFQAQREAEARGQAAATEAGTAGNKPVPIPMGDGSTRMGVPRYNARNEIVGYDLLPATPVSGAGAGAGPANPSQPPAAGGAPAPAPSAAPAPGPARTAPSTQAQTTASTSDTKHYYGTFPAVPQPQQQVGATPSSAQQQYNIDQGKLWAAQEDDMNKKAVIAAKTVNDGETMKTLATMFEPGAAADVRAKGANWLLSLGANPDDVNAWMHGSPEAALSLKKFTVANAFTSLREDLGQNQRVGQQEVLLKAQNSPNIELPRGAFNAMIDTQTGYARWHLAKQEAYGDWMSRPGATPAGFETWWNQNNPPEKFTPSEQQFRSAFGLQATGTARAQQAAPAAAGETILGHNPQTGEDFIRRADGSTYVRGGTPKPAPVRLGSPRADLIPQ